MKLYSCTGTASLQFRGSYSIIHVVNNKQTAVTLCSYFCPELRCIYRKGYVCYVTSVRFLFIVPALVTCCTRDAPVQVIYVIGIMLNRSSNICYI